MWNRATGLMRRVWPGPVRGRVVVGGAVVAGLAIGVVLLVAGRSDERPASAAVTVAPTLPMPTPTPGLTPVASPSSVVPDGPVKFAVCADIIGFRKLVPAEMQDVFTNKRFGDGVKPGPFYWAIYQSDYYWIREPHAISANVENFALSRGTTTGGEITNPGCGTPDDRQLKSYQALWIYDHRVVAMRADSGVLTVEVEARPGSREDVEFPDPAPPRSIPALKSNGAVFSGLRIVDMAGRLLLSRQASTGTWEFDDAGALVWGTAGSFGASKVSLRVAADLEFFCGQAHRKPAALTFTSAVGPPMTVNASGCTTDWDVAAAVHLEPGDWTIAADGDAYYTVLPKAGPRP